MNVTISLFEQLLGMAQEFLANVYSMSTTLIWWYVTPLYDIVRYYDPLNISAILRAPVFRLIMDYSLLELTLGVGVGIYLVYQFVTWLLDLIT